jgi:hypothetical protein
MHDHICGAYSYCEPNTKVCKRKAMLNEGCVVNGCFPPYQCTAGTCQAPPATPDPTCSANPMPPATTLTCAVSDGGIPFACAAGQTCCLPYPMGNQVGYDFSTCSAPGACPAGTPAKLTCNDTAQCPNGTKCNLVFPKDTTFMSGCNTSPSYELCRLDNASACNGAGCKPNTYWALPSNVGFCTVPTCKEPGTICNILAGSCAMCCSGSYHLPAGSFLPVCD